MRDDKDIKKSGGHRFGGGIDSGDFAVAGGDFGGFVKELVPYGIAGIEMKDAVEAAWMTYTSRDGGLPATPLIVDDNPYNDLVKDAKTILEIGCGVGRNANWVLAHTRAHFIGVEPNASMVRYFWNYVPHKYKSRVTLLPDFTELKGRTVDVIVSIFVMQHLNYALAPVNAMNPTEITQAMRKHAHADTVWFFLENGTRTKGWMGRWLRECGLDPTVFIERWEASPRFAYPDLAHRGAHNLMIWKGN